MTNKQPEPLRRADELEDIGAVSSLAREIAAHTIRVQYFENQWLRTKWVGLTDEEKLTIVRETDNPVDALAATEAKLREKNAND